LICRFGDANNPTIIVGTAFDIGHIIRQACEGDWITFSEAGHAGQTDLWFQLFGVYYLFIARNAFLLFVAFIFS